MSIGTFGPITFEVSADKTRTFDDFNRKTSAKFEQHDIIGLKPKLEFIAPGLDEISFQVIFSAFHGLNPLKEADQLREIVRKGEYHSLIIGGKVLGNFAIETSSEAWKYIDNLGNVLHIAVNVSLKEYFVDVDPSKPMQTDTAATQQKKVEQVITKVEEQAKQTGLSSQNISDLVSVVINGVRDPALAADGMTALLTATQGLQGGSVSSMAGNSYVNLGMDLTSLISRSSSDPMGAITSTLTQIASNDTPEKISITRNIYGAKTAGTVLLIAQQLKGVV